MKPHVVKLGGSLLQFEKLIEHLRAFAQRDCPQRMLLVVGGGQAVDGLRDFDARYPLNEAAAHWLAIRLMQANAHLIATALPEMHLVHDAQQAQRAWAQGQPAVVDPLKWLQREHEQGITIPHRWQFTSDSIAAHLAHRVEAESLTLLKSTLPCASCTLEAAAATGLVDACFPEAAGRLPSVRLVNLRESELPACALSV